MDAASNDIHNEPGQVESGRDLGRGQGDELPPVNRERRAGMVWISFEGLNETFQCDGPPGCWITEEEAQPVALGCPGSKWPRDEAWRKAISDAKKGRDSNRGRPVVFRGKEYKSQAEAARQCGCSKNTVARALGKSYGYRSPEQKARRLELARKARINKL